MNTIVDQALQEIQKKCMREARKAVAQEIKDAKAQLPVLKREVTELRKWKRNAQKQLGAISDREAEVNLAIKEIVHIKKQIDKLQAMPMSKFIVHSKDWWGNLSLKARAFRKLSKTLDGDKVAK